MNLIRSFNCLRNSFEEFISLNLHISCIRFDFVCFFFKPSNFFFTIQPIRSMREFKCPLQQPKQIAGKKTGKTSDGFNQFDILFGLWTRSKRETCDDCWHNKISIGTRPIRKFYYVCVCVLFVNSFGFRLNCIFMLKQFYNAYNIPFWKRTYYVRLTKFIFTELHRLHENFDSKRKSRALPKLWPTNRNWLNRKDYSHTKQITRFSFCFCVFLFAVVFGLFLMFKRFEYRPQQTNVKQNEICK